MLKIAEERTDDILREWASMIHWGPVNFQILAESCYMQGIHDVLDAMHQRGLTVSQAIDNGPWEGYCG